MHSGIAQDLAASSSGQAATAELVTKLERRLLRLEESSAVRPVSDEFGWFITNVDTRCLHYTHAPPDWPSELQRTSGCGWNFGQHRFKRDGSRPGGLSWRQICARCLPEYRAELFAIVSDVVADSD